MTPKELKYHTFYMDVASRTARMSHATRAKVGSVLVKNDNIVAHGWNGMPAGTPNDCEEVVVVDDIPSVVTRLEVQHSEANLLGKMLKNGVAAIDGTMYVTLEPCINCAKMIQNAGIKSLYYRDQYRDHSGIEYLKKLGVEVHHYNQETL